MLHVGDSLLHQVEDAARSGDDHVNYRKKVATVVKEVEAISI
jgi:hypothetical protein